MSGGVDSSVAATLLTHAGYEVVGAMLRLWSAATEGNDNRCCPPEAVASARQVASEIKIPFYVIDAQDEFYRQVIQDFIQCHTRGLTPNPCVLCNRVLRWGFLLQQAQQMKIDFIATGHYAKVVSLNNQKYELHRGVDQEKDQSYVLSMLNQDQLAHTIFPLGGMHKKEVRELARQCSLHVADRPDSQDLCFLGDKDFRGFLERYASQLLQPGSIIDLNGQKMGEHQGLVFFTIGQRKGLRISHGKPLYVIKKDLVDNNLIVGTMEQLGQTELVADQVNWISGAVPEREFRAQVKIRYKAEFAWAMIFPMPDEKFKAIFDQPLRDITPGQYAVLYSGDSVIGGGVIL